LLIIRTDNHQVIIYERGKNCLRIQKETETVPSTFQRGLGKNKLHYEFLIVDQTKILRPSFSPRRNVFGEAGSVSFASLKDKQVMEVKGKCSYTDELYSFRGGSLRCKKCFASIWFTLQIP